MGRRPNPVAASSFSSAKCGKLSVPPRSSRLGLRFPLVRRISDDDGDRFALLDLIGLAARLGKVPSCRKQSSSSTYGFPRVSVMNMRRSGPWHWAVGVFDQRLHFGEDAELGDGERTKLNLERDETIGGRLDRARTAPRLDRPRRRKRSIGSTPSRKVPVPTAGSATVTSSEASPGDGSKNVAGRASSARRTSGRRLPEAYNRTSQFAQLVVILRESLHKNRATRPAFPC